MNDPPELLEAFELYRPLALSIARRFGRQFTSLADDFESYALFALWRALPRLDPAGRPFRYLKMRITGELITFIRSKAARDQLAFREKTLEGEPNEVELNRVCARGPAVGSELDFADLVRVLSPRHRRIVDSYYRCGFTDADMGRRMRMSGTHAGYLRVQALDVLRSVVKPW